MNKFFVCRKNKNYNDELSYFKDVSGVFSGVNDLVFISHSFYKNIKKIFDFKFINIYFDILGLNKPFVFFDFCLKGKYSYSIKDLHDNEKYYDVENKLKMYVVYYKNKSRGIDYINYFHNGMKFKRDHFDEKGWLSYSQYLDEKGLPIREEFYGFDGKVRVIKYYNDGFLLRIDIINCLGLTVNIFSSESDLVFWWLEENFHNKNLIFDVGFLK